MYTIKDLLSGLLVGSLFACQSSQVKQPAAEMVPESDRVVERSGPLSFFDSVYLQLRFSRQQIEAYTKFDSSYFTGYHADAFLAGDTLFRFSHGITGTMLFYATGVSAHRYMLTYGPDGKLIDSREFTVEADRDGLQQYSYSQYRQLKDSIFLVTEYYMPEGSDSVVRETVTRLAVLRDGRIVEAKAPLSGDR